MVDISAEISGVKFGSCLMNASGPLCSSLEELKALVESDSGAVVLKSATISGREGNPSPRYYEDSLGSINSMGLPNLGYKKYGDFSSVIAGKGKPVIASISGFSLEEYVEMTEFFDGKKVDMIEVNLSCPNIPGKPQAGYNFDYSGKVLKAVREATSKALSVKLPPYFDIVHQKEMAGLLKDSGIDCIVLVNSVGNTLVIDSVRESTVIKPNSGLGGLGGAYIKPIALGNVRRFYELLEGEIPIIGVGGISEGVDVFEHILAGASAVQLGTVFAREGLSCFSRVKIELEEVMSIKGYKSLNDFRGKLKLAEEPLGDFKVK